MAPVATVGQIDQLEDQLKTIIHDLYCLMLQSYDYRGHDTENAMKNQVIDLITHLSTFSSTSRTFPTTVPPELLEYIENGRNPDVYTREFVEGAQRANQQLKGKSEAFAQFRDALAREMSGAMPELAGEVEDVLARGRGSGRS